MSRLIRDTDLLQGLQAVRDRETGTPRMMAEWFMTMVRDTPTAYDVETDTGTYRIPATSRPVDSVQ